MKYGEIFRRVRMTAGDAGLIQLTDAVLCDWINDAVRECVIENNFSQKTGTVPSIVGTVAYSLPTDVLKLYSVFYDNRKLRILTQKEWEDINADGSPIPSSNSTPTQVYVWAGKLNFYPPPNAIKNITINYIADPVDAVDGVTDFDNASPPIPASYHLRLTTYCLAQVALMDDNPQQYNNLMAMFRSGVIDLSQQTMEEEDLYPSMTISARDAGEEWVEW